MSFFRSLITSRVLFFGLGVAVVLLSLFASSLFLQKTSTPPPLNQLQDEIPPSLSPPSPAVLPQAETQSPPRIFSPESLRQLVAPIALYPDALIALILPASTVPSDVVLASRYLAAHGDPEFIPSQSWDISVQSLANYPRIVTWMDQNLAWTTTLGQAFMAQQADVMDAIQELRTEARAAGNLVNTPEQAIVLENTVIRIVPAEPDHIYVPVYNPEVVYLQPASQNVTPLVTFEVFLTAGPWLSYDFDWNRRQLYRGTWQPGWNSAPNQNGASPGGNGVSNFVNINPNTAHPWQPNPAARQQLARAKHHIPLPESTISPTSQFASGVAATSPVHQSGHNLLRIPGPSPVELGTSLPPDHTIVAPPQNSDGFVSRAPEATPIPLNLPAPHNPPAPPTPPNTPVQATLYQADYVQRTQVPLPEYSAPHQPASLPYSPANERNERRDVPSTHAERLSIGNDTLPGTVTTVEKNAPRQPSSVPTAENHNQPPPSENIRQVEQPPQAPVVHEASAQTQPAEKNSDDRKKDAGK